MWIYIYICSEILEDFNSHRNHVSFGSIKMFCAHHRWSMDSLPHWQTDYILAKINGVEAEVNSDVNNTIMRKYTFVS